MPDPIETIAIRNPGVIKIACEEMEHGAGRSATEAAENLIVAGAEARRMKRANDKPRARRPSKATAAP